MAFALDDVLISPSTPSRSVFAEVTAVYWDLPGPTAVLEPNCLEAMSNSGRERLLVVWVAGVFNIFGSIELPPRAAA